MAMGGCFKLNSCLGVERNYRIHSLKLTTILDLKHWRLWDSGGFPQWIYGIYLGFMGFAPENGWLKDYFCFGARPIFQRRTVGFREDNYKSSLS